MKERTKELHHANEMLKAVNLKLKRISMKDGLTSIENRRAFDIAYNRQSFIRLSWLEESNI